MGLRRRGLGGVFASGLTRSQQWARAIQPGEPPLRAPVIEFPARRMTYEEALGQMILAANQTVSGTNHLTSSASEVPAIAPNQHAKKEVDRRSRLPFTYMNIQGQAPAQITLPAAGSSQVVVSFTCPRRMNGEIEFVANQLVQGGWLEGTGELIWQILVDGLPEQGYDAILGSLGSTSAPGWLGTSAIQFTEQQSVQLRVTNVSLAAGGILLGLLRGHFYPVEKGPLNEW